MNQDQLVKALIECRELEYLFDNGQWVPAAFVHSPALNADSPSIVLRLLRYPVGRPGIVCLDTNDIQHHLRLKSTNS